MVDRFGALRAPFLRSVRWRESCRPKESYPFDLPILQDPGFEIIFTNPVTILVGENASGKSTLLEAFAELAGFHAGGGSRDHQYSAPDSGRSVLAQHLRASWLPKIAQGFFFRADSYINLSGYVEELATEWPVMRELYGKRHLHRQSHGESFLSLFEHRLKGNRQALYILDEPESALSPSRQIELMRLMDEWAKSGRVQVILATHSPLLMALPGATVLHLTASGIAEISYRATQHFKSLAEFFSDPDGFIGTALSKLPDR